MPYREFIPDPIFDEVASWNLSPALQRLLWKAAETEIRTRADSTLRRIVAPVRCFILPVSVEDPETGEERTFIFYLDSWIRQDERTVIAVMDVDSPCKEIESQGTAQKPDYR
jgi:hypothetical protein